MEQSDIKELVKILKDFKRNEDWDLIDEAILYLEDYLDEPDYTIND
jgi:hypothetical protein